MQHLILLSKPRINPSWNSQRPDKENAIFLIPTKPLADCNLLAVSPRTAVNTELISISRTIMCLASTLTNQSSSA